MKWDQEDYVLLDTRDTPEWISMPWQSRVLYLLLVRKADPDGLIRVDGSLAECLASLLRMPLAEVDVAMEGLLDFEYVTSRPGALVLHHLVPLSAQRTLTWSKVAYPAVYARDGRKCRYCTAVDDLTIDHVVPRCQGGKDTADNLVVACRSCNSRKNGRTASQARMDLLPIPEMADA